MYGGLGIGPGSKTGSGTVGVSNHGLTGAERRQKHARVRVGHAKVSPGLDKHIVRRYFRHEASRIRRCYEQELKKMPGLQGTLTAKFKIQPDGAVAALSVSGMRNSELTGCVAGVIRSMRFPRPENGATVTVSYPFILKLPRN